MTVEIKQGIWSTKNRIEKAPNQSPEVKSSPDRKSQIFMSRLDDDPKTIECIAEDEATVDEYVPDEQSDDVSF